MKRKLGQLSGDVSDSGLGFGGERAALYKSKSSVCHRANGEGKASMKAPALKGTILDVSQITEHIIKGDSTSKPLHNKGTSGASDEQAKSIADYAKFLQQVEV
jgi:mono/diheme cytochrome c family protein